MCVPNIMASHPKVNKTFHPKPSCLFREKADRQSYESLCGNHGYLYQMVSGISVTVVLKNKRLSRGERRETE